MPDEQARQTYKSPAELEKALLNIDQQGINQLQQLQQWQQFQRWSQQSQQQQWQQSQQQHQQQQQQVPPAQPPMQLQGQNPPLTQAQIEAYKLKNPELYDEVLADDLTSMASQTAQHLTQQQQEMQQLRAIVEQQQVQLQQWQVRQQQERSFQEQLDFDEHIRTLGNGWDDVLGEADAREMTPNSPEIVNRGKVYETARQLQQVHAIQGRQIPLTKLLPNSLQIAFPERHKIAASNGNSSRQSVDRERDSQGRFATARPTRRQHPNRMSAREAALRKWDSMERQSGSDGGGEEI
jgi:hypothetical protein